MAQTTKIQWTTHTQNFWRGCRKVHTGCENCYAENHFSCHLHGVHWGTEPQGGVRKIAAASTWNSPLAWHRLAQKTGQHDRVFCMSLGDIFESWDGPVVDHRDRQLYIDDTWEGPLRQRRDGAYSSHFTEPQQAGSQGFRPATLDDLRRDALKMIEHCTALDWLLLTKHGLWNDGQQVIRRWPHECSKCGQRQWWSDDRRCTSCRGKTRPAYMEHVWLLGSVSDQPTADRIVRQLHRVKKAGLCRFVGLSAEPIVGPVRLRDDWDWLDWVIIGGESTQGGECRRFDLDWARELLGDCRRLRIPAFVKQLGSDVGTTLKSGRWSPLALKDEKGGDPDEWPRWCRVRRYPTGEREL